MISVNEADIIILIISSTQSHYQALEDVIKKTWGHTIPTGCCILFLHGDLSKNTGVYGDSLIARAPEGLENIGYKMIEAFQYLLNVNKKFSFVYRTNLSSYIWIPGLLESIKDNKNTDRYSGVVGLHDGIRFASGSGYLISRDLVEKIVQKKNDWDHEYLDDVALGKMISKLNVPITEFPRVDIPNMKVLKKIKRIDRRVFHYRCKSDNGNRKFDIIAMNYLHSKYFNEKTKRKARLGLIEKLIGIMNGYTKSIFNGQ